MGMFNSVFAHCPSCDHEVEFQSKTGDCTLAEYNSERVPSHIAIDLHGAIEYCPNCRSQVKLLYTAPPKKVAMQVFIVSKEEDASNN